MRWQDTSSQPAASPVDTGAGKITIAHGPVEALKWPAMTMAFKASPEQLASVKAGQQVEFEFEAKGMDSTITRITPTK
ncbi:TPA: copper-binding protein [Pseudomonas aeruginosa]|nr:copper-binding protein [Pandoraea apista]TAA42145.1 copper-binding protein [Pseudoxanthomonas winnipegensis]HBN9180240.1 copper-binding protein [Pseudomonas aeruginosa]